MPENLPDDIVTALTITAILRLNQALNRHDVDAVMAAMTTDCVLKSAFLPPEGKRYQGHNAVRQGWETFFRCSPTAGFEIHEILPCRDRCVVPWMYHGKNSDRMMKMRFDPNATTAANTCPYRPTDSSKPKPWAWGCPSPVTSLVKLNIRPTSSTENNQTKQEVQ